MQANQVESGQPHAPNGGGISRRRVMQGVAWSAPAVLIATAAPAAAASPDPVGMLVFPNAGEPQLRNSTFWNGTANVPVSYISAALYFSPANADPLVALTVTWTLPNAPANASYYFYGSPDVWSFSQSGSTFTATLNGLSAGNTLPGNTNGYLQVMVTQTAPLTAQDVVTFTPAGIGESGRPAVGVAKNGTLAP